MTMKKDAAEARKNRLQVTNLLINSEPKQATGATDNVRGVVAESRPVKRKHAVRQVELKVVHS